MPYGFGPIAEKDAKILILGTMPSVASLKASRYYGHHQNSFWPIIFGLWGKTPPEDYNRRVDFLNQKRIALWDVLKNCDREGSADSAIMKPQPNDFLSLKKGCPCLKAVFFNSQNACRLYNRLVKPDVFGFGQDYAALDKSGPRNAFEDKLRMWLPVRDMLENSGCE